MSLKKLFKRKPGGTVLGNLVRGAVKTATGGILGNGALMISKEQYEAKQRGEKTDNARETKYIQESIGAGLNGIDTKDKANNMLQTIKNGGMKSIAYIVGGVAFIFGVVFLVKKMLSSKSPNKR